MKKNKNFTAAIPLIIAVLLLLGLGGYFLWQKKIFGCSSPVKVESWKEALGSLSLDKSRINLKKVVSGHPNSLYVGTLNSGEKSSSVWHSQGEQIFQIISGSGTLHSGKLENNKISWFDDVILKEGDAFLVEPKLIIQIESEKEHSLVFSLFAPDAHFRDDRNFVEDYDPEKSACGK